MLAIVQPNALLGIIMCASVAVFLLLIVYSTLVCQFWPRQVCRVTTDVGYQGRIQDYH